MLAASARKTSGRSLLLARQAAALMTIWGRRRVEYGDSRGSNEVECGEDGYIESRGVAPSS